jgi:outer membrane protein OmpA-like peptidoglycan-associated protein
VAETPGMTGYPTELAVLENGRGLRVSGLAPSVEVKLDLVERLQARLAGVDVRENVAALPRSGAGLGLEDIKRAVDGSVQPTVEREANRTRADMAGLAAELAALQERLSVIARTAATAETTARAAAQLKGDIETVSGEVAHLRTRAQRDELVAVTSRLAIFFGEGNAFRETAVASRTMDELAAVLTRTGGSLVRVVGYTDDVGASAANVAVARSRADTVVAGLVARNVPMGRLVALARTNGDHKISSETGAGSFNRRVEFEVGFVGDAAWRDRCWQIVVSPAISV